MKITERHLQEAVDSGILQSGQNIDLWNFLQRQHRGVAQFKAAHLLYHLGGGIAVSAMLLLMKLSHDYYGGFGVALLSLCYAAIGLALAEIQRKDHQALIMGVFATIAVFQTPFFAFGMLLDLGLWGEPGNIVYHYWMDPRWLWLELATLLTSSIALYRYRTPLLLLPASIAMWCLSMDMAPLFLQDLDHEWQKRKWFSVFWGLMTMLIAFYVDFRNRREEDFAFWLYFSGILSFWIALTSMDSDSELGKAIYAAINIFFLVISVALGRRLFAIFGSAGVLVYVSHLAFELFRESDLFPVVLCFIGFAVIYLGVIWQRNEIKFAKALQQRLPFSIQEMVERRR